MAIAALLAFVSGFQLRETSTPADYLFSPDDCEYSVVFESTPRINELYKEDMKGDVYPLYSASVEKPNGAGYLRAECACLGSIMNREQGTTRTAMLANMKVIADDMGIKRVNYDYEQSELGAVGTLWGVKETERGSVFVKLINYIGHRSVLTVTVAALSEYSETPEMVRFRESVTIVR